MRIVGGVGCMWHTDATARTVFPTSLTKVWYIAISTTTVIEKGLTFFSNTKSEGFWQANARKSKRNKASKDVIK